MNQANYLIGDNYPAGVCSLVRGRRISYSLFQKALKLNADLRKQIRDIIDLGLCEYAFRVNAEIIEAAKLRAESQSSEIMMKFLKGEGNYLLMKRIIHKNRIIRILAQKDIKEHDEMLGRMKQLRVVHS